MESTWLDSNGVPSVDSAGNLPTCSSCMTSTCFFLRVFLGFGGFVTSGFLLVPLASSGGLGYLSPRAILRVLAIVLRFEEVKLVYSSLN